MWESIIKAKDDYGDEDQLHSRTIDVGYGQCFHLANKIADVVENTDPDIPSNDKVLVSMDRLTVLFMDFEDNLMRWLKAFGG